MNVNQSFSVVQLSADDKRAVLRPIVAAESDPIAGRPMARSSDIPVFLSDADIGSLKIGDTIDVNFVKREVVS